MLLDMVEGVLNIAVVSHTHVAPVWFFLMARSLFHAHVIPMASGLEHRLSVQVCNFIFYIYCKCHSKQWRELWTKNVTKNVKFTAGYSY